MRTSIFLLGAAAALGACGQQSGNSTANQPVATAAAEKPKPAYCFFKDSETRAWKAVRGKDGNVVVSASGYKDDPRYKAALGSPIVTGSTAQIAPIMAPNDTGYASADNWWAMKATIPGSAAVTSVTVTCGEKTLATLHVPAKG